jgi:hypothetical protein
MESAPQVLVCYELLNMAAGPSNLSRFLLIFLHQLVFGTFYRLSYQSGTGIRAKIDFGLMSSRYAHMVLRLI